MENNNQKQHRFVARTFATITQQQPSDSDANKKESTNSGGNDDAPSTSSSQAKDILHDDLCSICFDDVSLMDIETFHRCYECGKAVHVKCFKRLLGAKGLSAETRNSCPMCRAKTVDSGSKEWIIVFKNGHCVKNHGLNLV